MSEIITIPVAQASANSDIVELLQTQLTQLQQMVNQFREQPPTPAAFCELEKGATANSTSISPLF